MRAHTNDYKTNIVELGREIESKITFGTTTITGESLNSITPITNSTILKSLMKELDFESTIQIPVGTVIKYEFGLLVNNEYEYINFGNYIVYENEYNADTNSYSHICYDKMLYSMKEYTTIQNGSFPMTVRDYIKNLCLDLGLTFKNQNTTFANYNRVINTDLYANLGYTYRDIFDELSAVTGSIIGLDQSDNVEVKYLNETNDEIDDSYLKDVNVTFKEKYGPINSVVLSRSAESDNVYLQDPISISQNGLCEIKIVDNQIMNNNDRSDYLPDLLDKLKAIEYYINDFDSTGIGYYEAFDKYNVKIGGNSYSCILFNDEFKVTQGIVESIYTEMPEETETDYTKSDKTDRKINQTYIIVDKQNQEIESLVSEIGDRSEKTTTITQDIDTISQQVSQIVDLTKEKTQNSALVIENAIESDLIKFSILGEMSLVYPKNSLYPSSTLYPLESYLIIEYEDQTQDRMHLPLNYLHYLNGTAYDEFLVENGKAKIIRRVGENTDGTLYDLGTQIEEDLGDFVIPVKTGYNKIWLESFFDKNLIYYAKYGTESDLTEVFATKVEMNTAIEQTATEINLEVSKKVDDDEVITAINLTSEEAKINASKITLEGIVTANENFKVLEDGSIEAVNGSFSGNIYLDDGNVVIGGDGLLTNLQYRSTGIYDGKSFCGFVFDTEGTSMEFRKSSTTINFVIPQNFTILNAYATIAHTRVHWLQTSGSEIIGYSRNVRLYNSNTNRAGVINSSSFATVGFVDSEDLSGSEIIGAFGENGYTATNTTVDSTEIERSVDIKDYIKTGSNTLFLRTADSTSSTGENTSDANSRTGAIQLTIDVIGYMSF